MGISGGPSILETGLVLTVDSANIKSFNGESTVNLIASASNNAAQEITNTSNEFYQYYNLVPIFDTHGLIPYTLSMEIKANKPGTCLVYMQNGSYTKYAFVSQVVNITTEYQRFIFPNITPSGPTAAWLANTPGDNRAMLATYTEYGTGVYPTVRNVQIEAKTYATPFVNGTRGTTVITGGGWRDLSGFGNDGEFVNTVQFDSGRGGALIFNGTNSHIKIPEISALNTQTPTVEVWVKTNATTQNGFWFEKGNVNTQYALFQEGANITWRQTTNVGSLTAPCASYMNTSQYAQVVGTFMSGDRRIYVNGVQVASDTLSYSIPTNVNGSSIGVYGGFNGGRGYYYNGNIAIVRVYNKALSPEEVLQNFNATRSRFGI